ncbi:pantoate--beta-alanine ligase [Rhodovulum sulfidophilum]|uniref:pantoate--beta-alanine ligase n=1 Tax=Rhodovulum sulfidophilum TaxID=35806 RepID=UPI001921ECD0|nr:pantoate--beta-alanine ligase [Rhodovulum sulfidophilum]MBL3559544.1 pantoate--beta-alanine ligase [Rhodovulum sulfidophilum]
MSAPILRSVAELRALRAAWRAGGARVAVVPTMGALHAGHLSLAAAAKAAADRVIVTIFVNPRQFNDPGDLARYPRTEARDAEKLAPLGVDAIYVPAPDQIYPPGFATSISVTGVSEGLCGAHRPGHFDGVATVVTKLLLQTGADCAFFGEKDYQQLMVVRRLVRDLDIPVEIVGCPTVREPDGLALSSRNALLPGDVRAVAPALYRALAAAGKAIEAGAGAGEALAGARAAILDAGFAEVEYLELRAAADLAPLDAAVVPARLLVAAHLGGVRLIDNIPVAAR